MRDLREDFPDAQNITLKKVKVDGKNLIGTFHIQSEDSLLQQKMIRYGLISRREIEGVEKKDKSDALSRLDKEVHVEFYQDEFDTIYLEKGSNFLQLPNDDRERKDVISQAKSWISFNCCVNKEDISVNSIFHQDGTFTILLEEYNAERDHYLVVEKEEESRVKEYRKIGSQDHLEGKRELEHLTKLPFTHGIEVEIQVVKDDWRWVDGDQMAIVFEEILNGARNKIALLRNRADKSIQAKWSGDVVIKKDDKGYNAVHLAYGPDRKFYSVLGKDSHVALKTNILELQTPPCEYLEELEWWIYNLYRISYEVVEQLDIGATVLSVGTNPVEEYSKGVTFGEHHHLGIEERELRNRVHNTFRFLTPHLISISSTTPFLGDKKPKTIFNEFENLVILEPANCMRLKKNREQFRIPPYLPQDAGKEYLKNKLGMTEKSLRMIDIYPFTRFSTVEVRMFDTQITTMDRISIAILLQALALYVKEGSDGYGADLLLSEDILKKNREMSIDEGLMGVFRSASEKDDRLMKAGSERYLYQGWKNIFQELWPYFEDMNIESSIYLKNLLLRFYEVDSSPLPLKPPIGAPQLLLYRGYLTEEKEDFEELLQELKYISTKTALDKGYNLWSGFVDLEEITLSDLQDFSSGSIEERGALH